MAATILRPVTGRLTMTYPPGADPRDWLLGRGARSFWRRGALHRFGPVELLLDGYARRACTAACQSAAGPACECSCLGRYHGARDAWRVDFGAPRPEVELVGWVEPGLVARDRAVVPDLGAAGALLGRSVGDTGGRWAA